MEHTLENATITFQGRSMAFSRIKIVVTPICSDVAAAYGQSVERVRQAVMEVAAFKAPGPTGEYDFLAQRSTPKRLPKPPMARRIVRFNPACSQRVIRR